MNRTVGVERLFSVSDFNNIRSIESLNEIPEELATNETFVNKVRLVQLTDVELTFRKYLVLKNSLDQMSPEDAIAKLEELKSNAMDELNQILNKEE
jgi:hypothetical protein